MARTKTAKSPKKTTKKGGAAKCAPIPVLVIYRPKKGKERELEKLVRSHGPMMRGTGLLAPEPVRTFRAHDKEGRGDDPGQEYFVEFMTWRDAEAPGIAHQTPEVMSVWEPMGAVLEELKIAHMEVMTTS